MPITQKNIFDNKKRATDDIKKDTNILSKRNTTSVIESLTDRNPQKKSYMFLNYSMSIEEFYRKLNIEGKYMNITLYRPYIHENQFLNEENTHEKIFNNKLEFNIVEGYENKNQVNHKNEKIPKDGIFIYICSLLDIYKLQKINRIKDFLKNDYYYFDDPDYNTYIDFEYVIIKTEKTNDYEKINEESFLSEIVLERELYFNIKLTPKLKLFFGNLFYEETKNKISDHIVIFKNEGIYKKNFLLYFLEKYDLINYYEPIFENFNNDFNISRSNKQNIYFYDEIPFNYVPKNIDFIHILNDNFDIEDFVVFTDNVAKERTVKKNSKLKINYYLYSDTDVNNKNYKKIKTFSDTIYKINKSTGLSN